MTIYYAILAYCAVGALFVIAIAIIDSDLPVLGPRSYSAIAFFWPLVLISCLIFGNEE